MSILAKIWYTWAILAIPFSLFGWMFFSDEYENEHPIIWSAICTFLYLPIAIGLASMLIWGIVQVWN